MVLAFALVLPSCAKGWKTDRKSLQKAREAKANSTPMKITVSNQDKELTKMRAYKIAAEEMEENADDMAMLARVDEITERLLRESFPEAYITAPKKIRAEDSDDIWENGTVVRYIARGMALLLAMAGLYAWADKNVAEKPDRTIKDTPPRSRVRATTRAAATATTSESRKTR
ncbi:unnamed protein product [Scytosiphon promiscuus]